MTRRATIVLAFALGCLVRCNLAAPAQASWGVEYVVHELHELVLATKEQTRVLRDNGRGCK